MQLNRSLCQIFHNITSMKQLGLETAKNWCSLHGSLSKVLQLPASAWWDPNHATPLQPARSRWSPFCWRSSKILESALSSAEEANYSTPAPCSNAGPMRDLSENTHNHHNNNTNWSSCVYHNYKNNVHHHHHHKNNNNNKVHHYQQQH